MEQEPQALLGVTLVVDANVVFSVMLRADGRMAKAWWDAQRRLKLIAPTALKSEIEEHRTRLAKGIKCSVEDTYELEALVLKEVNIVSDELVSRAAKEDATNALMSIDADDTPYLALAIQYQCGLWTGDLRLLRKLARKGYRQVVDTAGVSRMLGGL